MPSPFKSLISRLRRRRRSSQEDSRVGGGEGKQPSLTKQLQALTLDIDMDVYMAEPDDADRYHFGSFDDFNFTFEAVSTTKWPGPPYDEHARFAPGVFDNPRPARPRIKQRSPKRKLSQQDHGHAKTRTAKCIPDKNATDQNKTRTLSRPIQYYGSPPPRDEPLHLLSLPGEIRNHIYRLLCAHREPLIAQYKPIMLPRKGRSNPNRITVRRFPREPVLALGNVQLRDEVLSIFYGANKFVIRPTDNLDLKEDSLFFRSKLQKWTPEWGMVSHLTRIEIRFNVRLPAGGKMTVNWSFRKLADGQIVVEQESEVEEHCMCFDDGLVEDYRELSAQEETQDLVFEVGRFLEWRKERLEEDDGFVQNGNRFRPVGLKCEACGRDHLRVLEQGL